MKVYNAIRESDQTIAQDYFPRTLFPEATEDAIFNFSYPRQVEVTERTTAIFKIKKKKK